MNIHNKKTGFTLAEVLITLGIIGVVAAMTIPTLIQNTNSVKFSSQFKKTLSTLNNSIEMAQAHFDTDLSSINQQCGNNPELELLDVNSANYRNSVCGLMNSTLANSRYIGTPDQAYDGVGEPNQNNTMRAQNAHVFALPDGAWVVVPELWGAIAGRPPVNPCMLVPGNDPAELDSICHGYIDVNGIATPNRMVKCQDEDLETASAARTRPREADEENDIPAEGECIVRKNGQDMGDVFPIVFHDNSVSPSSRAAVTVLGRL